MITFHIYSYLFISIHIIFSHLPGIVAQNPWVKVLQGLHTYHPAHWKGYLPPCMGLPIAWLLLPPEKFLGKVNERIRENEDFNVP